MVYALPESKGLLCGCHTPAWSWVSANFNTNRTTAAQRGEHSFVQPDIRMPTHQMECQDPSASGPKGTLWPDIWAEQLTARANSSREQADWPLRRKRATNQILRAEPLLSSGVNLECLHCQHSACQKGNFCKVKWKIIMASRLSTYIYHESSKT